jgi:hypothetical protein
MVDSPDPEVIMDRLNPFVDLGPLIDQSVVLTSYAGVMANASDAAHNGQGEPTSRSGLLEHVDADFAEAAAELISGGAVHFFQIRAAGGAVGDVAPDATAYAHRSANFSVVAIGSSRERVDAAWDQLLDHFTGLYLSFDTDLRPERVTDAFPPATLARLRALKAEIDPQNVFRDNFNVVERDPARMG